MGQLERVDNIQPTQMGHEYALLVFDVAYDRLVELQCLYEARVTRYQTGLVTETHVFLIVFRHWYGNFHQEKIRVQ